MDNNDNSIKIDVCNYTSCINSNLSSKANVYSDGLTTINRDNIIEELKVNSDIDPEFVQKVLDNVHYDEFTSRVPLDKAINELNSFLDNAPDSIEESSDPDPEFLTNINLVESKNKDGCSSLDLIGTGIFDRLLSTTIKSLEYLQNKGVIDKANMGDKFMQLYGINLQSAVQYAAQLEQIKLQKLQVNSQTMLAKMQAMQIKAQLLELPLQAESLYLDGKLKEAQYSSSKLQAGLVYLQYKEATLKELLMEKQLNAADLANIKAREEILGLRVNIDKIEIEKQLEQEKIRQSKVQTRIMKYQIQDEVEDENGETKHIAGMMKIQKDTAIEQKNAIRREATFKIIQSALSAWGVSKAADPTIKSPDLAKAAVIDTMVYYYTKTYGDIISKEQYLTYFGAIDSYSEYLNIDQMTAEGGKATNACANVLRPYFNAEYDKRVNEQVAAYVYDTAVKLVPILNDEEMGSNSTKLKTLDNKARGALLQQGFSNQLKYSYGVYLYNTTDEVPASDTESSTNYATEESEVISNSITTPTVELTTETFKNTDDKTKTTVNSYKLHKPSNKNIIKKV